MALSSKPVILQKGELHHLKALTECLDAAIANGAIQNIDAAELIQKFIA